MNTACQISRAGEEEYFVSKEDYSDFKMRLYGSPISRIYIGS